MSTTRKGLSRIRRLGLGLTLAGFLGASLQPSTAQAWDPSVTAQAIVTAALRTSAWHLAWMDGSELQRGVFTPLRLDPQRLDPGFRSWLQNALRSVHADVGARPLGGPGACPGSDATALRQQFCVSGDLWELDALGWLRLGIVAESSPRSRLLHHFSDLQTPSASTWSDSSESSKARLRSVLGRSSGEPIAGSFSGSNFSGESPSALGFLASESDPLALPAMSKHLAHATMGESQETRDHHLALALISAGASLRVVMDQGVPAYARGDAGAQLLPLSSAAGDLGNPFIEFVRSEFGADLPSAGSTPSPPPSGDPLAPSVSAHLLGYSDSADLGPGYEGLIHFGGARFLSPGGFTSAKALDPELSAEAAADALLSDGDGLDPTEREGLHLAPWPAPSGYLRNTRGRALAAFETDAGGLSRLFVDTSVMRDQAAHLLPRTVEATRSVLDLWFASFPKMRSHAGGRILELDLDLRHAEPRLHVLEQDAKGARSPRQRLELRAGESNRVAGLFRPRVPEHRTVLVLEWSTADGQRLWAEHVLAPLPDKE